MRILVSLSYSLFEPLTYEAPDDAGVEPGSRVLVPLGRRLAVGWVIGLDSSYAGRLKRVIGIVDDPFRPDPGLLEFARLTATAYFTSAGSILDLSLPPSQKNLKGLQLQTDEGRRPLSGLSPADLGQRAAAGPLRLFFKTPSPPEGAPVALAAASAVAERLRLGPGRAEEYRRACAAVVAAGGSVVLLAPDIATARYWQAALPGVDPFHSGITPACRERTWRQYRLGRSGVVCGGLAALALPLPRPGLLIVDRAASPLYRRAMGSPLRLDHLAGIRAAAAAIPLLRGADSHTCATFAEGPRLQVEDQRRGRAISRHVHALKGGERGIPQGVIDLVRGHFLAGKKTLVLANRIRPAVRPFCAACGRAVTCPRCAGILEAGAAGEASCRRCSFRRAALNDCPRCGKPLEALHDVSVDSLVQALERVCGEGAVRSLTAAELKDPAAEASAAEGPPVVVATLAALSPRFAGAFAAAIWVKPESFFALEEHDGAEMIHACGAEIAATLADGGELHAFSVFHFHYALQHLGDEAAFFEREMKYRQWFRLPPFAAVYELELRAPALRALAAAMREIFVRHRQELQASRAYLISRLPQRGTYRGVIELHAAPERIAAAGLHRFPRSALRRIAG